MYLNTPTWITGLKLHQSGVKQLGFSYQESRGQWNWNAQEFVHKLFTTSDWKEIPKNSEPYNGINLPEGITAPILFKFVPLLTDLIVIYIKDSFNTNDETFVKELELHSDCKLKDLVSKYKV